MSLKKDFQTDPRLPVIKGAVFKIDKPTRNTLTGEVSFQFLVYGSEDQRKAEKAGYKALPGFIERDADLGKRIKEFNEGAQARIEADPDSEAVVKKEGVDIEIELAKLKEEKAALEKTVSESRAIEGLSQTVNVPLAADVTNAAGDVVVKKLYVWAKTLDAFAGATDV